MPNPSTDGRPRGGAEAPASAAADHPAIFHITHHKAGSQWIAAILRRLAGPVVAHPRGRHNYLSSETLGEGRIYPTVYLSRPDFEALDLPDRWTRFIVVRDLRDALVSAYWSLRLSHPENSESVSSTRGHLQAMNLHDGLSYLVPIWQSEADLVASWLGAPEEMIRYEDIVADDVGVLVPLFCDQLGLTSDRDHARRVIESARFEKLTRGRPRGAEDVTAHQRKGVPGDWRSYIVGPVADAFKERYGQLLIDTGYETDLDW